MGPESNSSRPEWPWRTDDTALSVDEVRIWRLNLDDADAVAAVCGTALSPDERARGARFRDPVNQTRFTAVRGWLREVLSGYVDQSPADLRFRYGLQGKPALASLNPLDVRFNVSHSGGIALLAVGRGREIGVDVERARGGKLRLAERFFSDDEVGRLRELAEDEQVNAFYRCWTRKEAFVKARGEGLSLPLNRFAVSLGPGEPPALRWVAEDRREATRWTVHDLPAIPGYAAALVVEGEIRSLACARWQVRSAGQS